jgi:RNA polymerase sigma-70 factor (ECF subfamily)
MAAGVNRTTFDRLVRANLRDAHRFALRLLGAAKAEAAEELVTEALYRAARGWMNYRGGEEERTFRGWFWRIIVNAFRDQVARRRSDESLSDADAKTDPAAGPLMRIEAREIGEVIAALVSGLPPRQREVMVLLAYEGHTAAEAAAVLGMTEQNIRVTLHLAREKLREKLIRRMPEWFESETETSP